MERRCANPECTNVIKRRVADRKYCSRSCWHRHRPILTAAEKLHKKFMGERAETITVETVDGAFVKVKVCEWGNVFRGYYYNHVIYIQPVSLDRNEHVAFVYRPGDDEPCWQGNFKNADLILSEPLKMAVSRIRELYTALIS